MSEVAARDAVIAAHCRELKLPRVLRDYRELSRQANDSSMAYEDYLRDLLETEVIARRDSTAKNRIRQARFPDPKTLDQLDYQELTGIGRPKVLELAHGDFIDRGEDVVIAGPIGTGKTHLAIALGIEAAQRRRRVRFFRAADLVRTLVEARDDRQLTRLTQSLGRVDLLILDELGFVPFDKAGGELLFNLLSDRYERRSTIVTTNLAFSEWVQVFGCEKLTTALLDRLGHHSHILTTRGASYRTRKRKKSSTKSSAPKRKRAASKNPTAPPPGS